MPLSLAPEVSPRAPDSSPSETVRDAQAFTCSQHSHGGSLGPSARQDVHLASSVPVASSGFVTWVLLAFPSASVIRCKRGRDTKVTLSPRMDFLQLTCVHGTAVHSLLTTCPALSGRAEDRGSGNSALPPTASRTEET